MALATLAQLMTVPFINKYTPAFLQICLDGADAAVKNYVKQNIEEATYTEYYTGPGTPELILNQRPVSPVSMTLNLDLQGNFGENPDGAFGTGTLLTYGKHYELVLDKGGTVSNRGIVRLIGVSGSSGGWWPYSQNNYYGKLFAGRYASWPNVPGCIKVVYKGGFASVPQRFNTATIMLASLMARTIPYGAWLQSENLGAYSYSLAPFLLGTALELGSARQLLASFREPSF